MKTYLAIAVIFVSLGVLELARSGVQIARFTVGDTPVVSYSVDEADGPVVVVAHGFAGSEQMMQGYALPLARAGYRVFSYEFLGHGRNPVSMSGDVTVVDGTTGLLVAQTNAVIDRVGDGDVALIGHSMATDVLVRVAAGRDDVGPMVLISAFSQVIDEAHPRDLLLVTGAWEGGLRAFGLEAVQMVAQVGEGETAVVGDVRRRAVAAPFTEHVSVLQSRFGRAEAVSWLDGYYERHSDVRIWPTGWAILGLLGGLVMVFPAVLAWVSSVVVVVPVLSRTQLALVVGVPAVVAPALAVPLNPGVLPVLVADYLGLHLLIFGAVQLGLLWLWGVLPRGFSWRISAALLLWCVLFGVGLDRYAANFLPTVERVWIIAVLAIGAVPYMLADAVLTSASVWRRITVRLSFLGSLGIAVALDFEGLFFLLMIAPVLVLFYLVFGTMGRMATVRSGPLGAGLVLGLVLAWALGVSFPLFQA
jgi:pimeloyl-ACP methyl ester carboxylesterase